MPSKSRYKWVAKLGEKRRFEQIVLKNAKALYASRWNRLASATRMACTYRGFAHPAGRRAKNVSIARLFGLAVTVSVPAAIASRAAAVESAVPLADIRLDNGQVPNDRIRPTAAFIVRGGASIEARVVAPADAFLCRLTPAANRDVVQMSIGRVESLRCNSLYSPSRDLAITLEADRVELHWRADHWQVTARGPLTVRSEPDFMRIKRGISYYRPLSETVFSRAPAGWCSWYICGQCIDEEMITKNTDWLAANLKKFGCEYVQIDDGWQGVGHGDGENRDWYVTDKHKFPHGMKWLADYIRGKGFKPGIWLIPFATSDEKLFRQHPDFFIRRADGTSVFEEPDAKTGKVEINWTGHYAIDPTNPRAGNGAAICSR